MGTLYNGLMAIVHLHVERTAGVSVQHLYEQRYRGNGFLWYSTRDGLFAPFNIQHGRYEDAQMQAHAHLARDAPDIRARILQQRTSLRLQHAVPPEQLADKAKVVLGHFALNMISRFLPASEHEYRTVVRDPLQRMWSHYNFWRAYNGDVGHRAVPPFSEDTSFEQFALHGLMQNYQTQATGTDPGIYTHLGTTRYLTQFVQETGLAPRTTVAPTANHFSDPLPPLSPVFVSEFQDAHREDYAFYAAALVRSTQPVTIEV